MAIGFKTISNLLSFHFPASWFCSQRWSLAIIGFFGYISLYALRFNLSVAIVCMVNHTAVDEGMNITEIKSSLCSRNESSETEILLEVRLQFQTSSKSLTY